MPGSPRAGCVVVLLALAGCARALLVQHASQEGQAPQVLPFTAPVSAQTVLRTTAGQSKKAAAVAARAIDRLVNDTLMRPLKQMDSAEAFVRDLQELPKRMQKAAASTAMFAALQASIAATAHPKQAVVADASKAFESGSAKRTSAAESISPLLSMAKQSKLSGGAKSGSFTTQRSRQRQQSWAPSIMEQTRQKLQALDPSNVAEVELILGAAQMQGLSGDEAKTLRLSVKHRFQSLYSRELNLKKQLSSEQPTQKSALFGQALGALVDMGM